MAITFLSLKIQKYTLHIWIQHELIFHNQVLDCLRLFWLLRKRALNLEHFAKNFFSEKVGSTKSKISQKALKSGG